MSTVNPQTPITIDGPTIDQVTIVSRHCGVYGCSEMIEGSSHARMVSAYHDHLRTHTWNEKRNHL